MKHRLIVVPIIRRPDGRYLLIKMSPHRGVFPGQWGLPGGGVEDGETIEDALRREVREELRIELRTAELITFKAETLEKLLPSGERKAMYMVFLVFCCTTEDVDPVLNEEFDAFASAAPGDLASYDLNVATVATLRQIGIMTG
jgi:nucleoside triphosphatase